MSMVIGTGMFRAVWMMTAPGASVSRRFTSASVTTCGKTTVALLSSISRT